MNPVDDWTEGRFNAFIVSVLRGGMRRFPNKWRALEAALYGSGINETTGRKAKLYTCASCAKLFTAKAIEIDHIEPVVNPVTGFTTWDDYISRLFCPTYNLQALCKPCHKQKTKEEKSLRKTSPLKTGLKPPTRTRSMDLKKRSRANALGPMSGKTSVVKPKRSSATSLPSNNSRKKARG